MNARMLRIAILAPVLGLTTGLLPARVPAQELATLLPERPTVIVPGIPASDGELTSTVLARSNRGDVLTGMRQYTAAQREYRAAAEVARREGHLPSFTMWRLASAYYYQGASTDAADVLEQLAAEAARYGDLPVEALALYNSAWLNGDAGRGRTAASQLSNLAVLLQSPYMPVELRDHLNARLHQSGPFAVRR